MMLWQFQVHSRAIQTIHTHVSILLQTPLSSRLQHNIEQSSLCYTVGPCCLSILYIVVCISDKAMAPHSSTLAWKIPWMEEPGRLQSMDHEESDTTERLHFHFHALEKEMATHSSVLAWRIPGTGEARGLLSMGSHRVGHDWSDLAVAAAAASWGQPALDFSSTSM